MLCNESGASAIGLVIVTFFVFLLVLLPLNLFVQELNVYKVMNHQVQVATEMSCFDAVLRLDAVAMSEEKFALDSLFVEWFEAEIIKRMTSATESELIFEQLEASLVTDRQPNRLYVKFKYLYETRFIFKDHLSKWVDVELSYELPLNN